MHDFYYSQIRQANRRLRSLARQYNKLLKTVILSLTKLHKIKQQIIHQINFLQLRISKKIFIKVLTAGLGTNFFIHNNALHAQNFKPAEKIESLDFEFIIIPELFDLDNDGDLDLIGANYNPGLHYFENIGSNKEFNFVYIDSNQLTFPDSEHFNSFIHTVDVDKDGKLDIMTSGINDISLPTFQYFKNLGGASFDHPQEIVLPFTNSIIPFNIDMKPVDFDLDGDLDVLVFKPIDDFQEISLVYYENSSSSNELNFKSSVINPMGLEPFVFETFFLSTNQIEVADFDNDGDMDIIYSPNFSYGYSILLFFIRNDGDSFATPRQISGISNIAGINFITHGDLDDDGDIDLLFQNVQNENSQAIKTFYWLENESIDLTSTKTSPTPQLQLYPNPAEQKLYLDIPPKLGQDLQLKIIDQSGKLISENMISINQSHDQFEISVEHLTPGIYICQLTTNEFSITKKFVKQE